MLRSNRLCSVTVPQAWRFFSQRQITRKLTKNHEPEGPTIRKHLVQPSTEKHAKRYEQAFRAFWGYRKSKLENLRLGGWTRAPVADYHRLAGPAPRGAVSATRKWLMAIGPAVYVIPRNLVRVEFPAGEMAPPPETTPEHPQENMLRFEDTLKPRYPSKAKPKRTPKRTQEDRERLEAVLELELSPVAKYVSSEMMDGIKESPYFVDEKNAVVLRCLQHQTQGANKRQCIINLSKFIRNVANEIVYRENTKEGAYDHLGTTIISEAESKAMAWDYKNSFTYHMRQRQKKTHRELVKAKRSEFNQTKKRKDTERKKRQQPDQVYVSPEYEAFLKSEVGKSQ